eukprot:Opistho-2@49123
MMHFPQSMPYGNPSSAFWPTSQHYASHYFAPIPTAPMNFNGNNADADAYSALLQLATQQPQLQQIQPAHASAMTNSAPHNSVQYHGGMVAAVAVQQPSHQMASMPARKRSASPGSSAGSLSPSPHPASEDSGISSPKADDLKSLSGESSTSNSVPKKNRVKRPMNSFMIFGQKHRASLQKMHPGKDNKAISKMLGDMWFSLGEAERKSYADASRDLAEEHKKLHPEWKFKRNIKKSKGARAHATHPSANAANIARTIAAAESHRFPGYRPVPCHASVNGPFVDGSHQQQQQQQQAFQQHRALYEPQTHYYAPPPQAPAHVGQFMMPPSPHMPTRMASPAISTGGVQGAQSTQQQPPVHPPLHQRIWSMADIIST